MTPTYRLLALDLDGTLFGADGIVSPRVRAAISSAQERGVIVTLATGRALAVARRYALDLGLTAPLVTYQGALIQEQDTGRILFQAKLPLELVPAIVDRAVAEDLDLHFQAGSVVYVRRQRHDAHLDSDLFGLPIIELDDLAAGLPEAPTKFVIVCAAPAAEALVAHLQSVFDGQLDVVRTHSILVEGVPHGVSKGSGLALLARHLGLKREQVLAIGDNDNDVSMLRWAGLGVAMGNATPDCRAAADWIAPPIWEDGAAVAIERLVLEDGRG